MTTRKPRVFVACEFSGVVRRAFAAKGAEAVSCDLLPADDGSPDHIVGDVRPLLMQPWDMVIAHPPCTYLANSGVRWLWKSPGVPDEGRWQQMCDAADFFRRCLDANSECVAVENPIMHRYGRERVGRRADQCIQPWMFGHGEQKATCLWLKNLPPLMATSVVTGREQRMYLMSPSPERSKERSRTYEGIASAMADQWWPFISGE